MKKRITTAILLTLFLTVMFGGLFHMSSNMNMSMGQGMSDCPFMSHGEVLCNMNFTDHVSAWKTAFLSVVPTFLLLMFLSGGIALAVSIAPNLLSRLRYIETKLLRYIQERTYAFSFRPLQELFSSGILHPKLF